MTVIYKTSTVKLEKTGDREYKLTVPWEGEHKKFWVNFPYPLLKITGKSSPQETRTFTIRARSIQTLDQLISKGKGFISYGAALAFLNDVGNQIQALERFEIGIPFVDVGDIVVVDDKHFFYMNDVKTTDIVCGEIEILDPYKPTHFFSPEFRSIKGIPAKISYKSAYYSLAALVTYSLTNHALTEENAEELLNPIYATKLSWALGRCLEVKPANRYYLII